MPRPIIGLLEPGYGRARLAWRLRQAKWAGLGLALLIIGKSVAAAELQPRVIEGREAKPGEFPWQVALIAWDQAQEPSGLEVYLNQFCGGALIAPDWVLTSAHCVAGREPRGLRVVAGTHDLGRVEDARIEGIAQIVVHPAYDDRTFDNDIALLRLGAPVRCPSCASIECVDPQNEPDLLKDGSTFGIVSGWGTTSAQRNSKPFELQWAELPFISHERCIAEADYSADLITGNMLCAGYLTGGKDACRGDSGGPYVVPGSDGTGYLLAGVVSWGNGCAKPGYPGVYSRISSYNQWIKGKTHYAPGSGAGGLGAALPAALLLLLFFRRLPGLRRRKKPRRHISEAACRSRLGA